MSVTVIVILLAATAIAQVLPQAKTPEEVGMSSERLARLTSVFQEDVDKGIIPSLPTFWVAS